MPRSQTAPTGDALHLARRASMIDVAGLHVAYGQVHAVRGISLQVPPGRVLGIVGGNGAGKSSTMRCLAGVLPVSAGRVCIDGADLATPDGVEHARSVSGYCPDVGGLIRGATLREHVGLTLAFHHRHDDLPQALDVVEQLQLAAHLDQPTAGFSHGMSRRASVALAVIAARRVLILDEPFDGVDPVGVDATLAMVASAARSGTAVLLCTHLLELVTACADDVIVMAGGQLVHEGPAGDLAGPNGRTKYRELLSAATSTPVAPGVSSDPT